MRLHNPSRARAMLAQRDDSELRRQISVAAAQYRRPAFHEDSSQHSRSDLQAHLLPLDEQGFSGTSCQIEVKDFDERGITFQHPRPLHDRRALLVLEGPNLGRIAAEVDLSWCRFSQRGQYTSGGRFVGLVGMSA